MSIFLASYFKICIDKNKENERAGIKPLNDEVKILIILMHIIRSEKIHVSVILILTLLLVTINQAKNMCSRQLKAHLYIRYNR